MGWLHTMGKRVALRVSSIVARKELFERYGERPVQPPLKPGTWVSPSSEEAQQQQLHLAWQLALYVMIASASHFNIVLLID